MATRFSAFAPALSRNLPYAAMADEMDDDSTQYAVVLNDEEQYSIWPLDLPLPAGWRREGTTGAKAVCLAQVKRVWTDMTPASLRRARAGTTP
jgi:MbtH protein